jgi:hypothetical protein
MATDRVGPERRREAPLANVATAGSATAAANATAVNAILEVLREAGFIPR